MPSCEAYSWSGNFESNDCDNPAKVPCIYGTVAGLSPRSWNCEVGVVLGQGNSNTACYTSGPGWFNRVVDVWGGFSGLKVGVKDLGPGSEVWGREGPVALDVNMKFMVPGTPEYVFVLKPIQLLVNPCNPTERYCSDDEKYDRWLARITYIDANGWQVWCNTAGRFPGDHEPDRQLFDRQFPADLAKFGGEDGLAFIYLHLGTGVHCFLEHNHFCFQVGCGPGASSTWDCIGADQPTSSQAGVIGQAADRLFTAWNPRYSTDNQLFPHGNTFEIPLKNNALQFWGSKVDQLDAPGHVSRAGSMTESTHYLWKHRETYDENNPAVLQEEFEAFPTMVYMEDELAESSGVPLYPGGAVGQEVPINGHAWLSGVDYPCCMKLHSCDVTLFLLVESEAKTGSDNLWRVKGHIRVEVTYRVALKPEAYDVSGPFKFFMRPGATWPGNLEAQFDLRLEDPDNPGQPHPVEKIIAYGPNGERVPAHQGNTWSALTNVVRTPTLLWKGQRSGGGWSLSGIFFTPCTEYWSGNGDGCCGALQAIEANPIHGAYNDMGETVESGPLPQRYQGWVAFEIPWMNAGAIGTVGEYCKCRTLYRPEGN